MTRKNLFIGITILAVVTALLVWPLISDLWLISETKKQYMLNEAVHRQHGPKEITATEFLNPPFMKEFGLDLDDYLDKEGYFSPKGHHWVGWDIKTKTVAVLMWNDREELSTFETLAILQCVNDYIKSSDKSVAILKVVKACRENE